jgi:hypothetical protein
MISTIPVRSMNGEPAPGALRRSQSGGRFGCRVIDLDSKHFRAHDLLGLLHRKWGGGGFALAGSSLRGSDTGAH